MQFNVLFYGEAADEAAIKRTIEKARKLCAEHELRGVDVAGQGHSDAAGHLPWEEHPEHEVEVERPGQ